MAHNKKVTLTIALTVTLLTVMLVSCVHAQTGSLFIAESGAPNVLSVTGNGFDPDSTVTLGLYMGGLETQVSTLPGATTDAQGNFALNVSSSVAPAMGVYFIMANTTNVSAYQGWFFSLQNDQQQTGPSGNIPETVSVSPPNSNIFNVTGQGYDANKPVTLKLAPPHGPTAYTFPDQISTDSHGRFSAIVIVPTTPSLSGTFNLAATTTINNVNSTANVTVTIPNLQGPQGPAGLTGATGATGDNGTADSTSTNATLTYVSITLSVIAIIIGIYAITKKRKPLP